MFNIYQLNMESLAEVYCYEYHKIHNKYPDAEILSRKVLLAKCENLRKESARSL